MKTLNKFFKTEFERGWETGKEPLYVVTKGLTKVKYEDQISLSWPN